MKNIGPLQIAIILLTVATALIHIVLAIPENLWMFYLNGIGYLVLVTALYMPQFERQRGLIRWVLIAYTAVTIIAWVWIGERNTIGYVNKLIEAALIVLLFIDGRQSRQDASTLRQVATRLRGVYHNGNEHHLSTTLVNQMTSTTGQSKLQQLTLRELALIGLAISGAIFGLLPLMLHFWGTRWRPGV